MIMQATTTPSRSAEILRARSILLPLGIPGGVLKELVCGGAVKCWHLPEGRAPCQHVGAICILFGPDRCIDPVDRACLCQLRVLRCEPGVVPFHFVGRRRIHVVPTIAEPSLDPIVVTASGKVPLGRAD